MTRSPETEPQAWFRRWSLVPDGEPIRTPGSDLFPVRQDGQPAMLKIAHDREEQFGAEIMIWWNGDGAAKVLAHETPAILLERATGSRSLADMARNGRDDEACRILCATTAKLHKTRPTPRPDCLVPLARWFDDLHRLADAQGGALTLAAHISRRLLADPRDVCLLHGDIHHANVLDFGESGWKAIDPKRVVGERAFDFANIFNNPDAIFDRPDLHLATAPAVLARRTHVIAAAAGLDHVRLLHWVVAYSGLSAAWFIEEQEPEKARLPLTVAAIAAGELGISALPTGKTRL